MIYQEGPTKKIKFRIWDKTDKKFIYWGFFRPGIFIPPPLAHGIYTSDGVESASESFTNLYDKIGCEIWEGDIVRDGLSSMYCVEWCGDEGGYCFEITNDPLSYGYYMIGHRGERLRVVGNIHEGVEPPADE